MFDLTQLVPMNNTQGQLSNQVGPNFLKAAHQELVSRQKTAVQTMSSDELQKLIQGATQSAQQKFVGATGDSATSLSQETPPVMINNSSSFGGGNNNPGGNGQPPIGGQNNSSSEILTGSKKSSSLSNNDSNNTSSNSQDSQNGNFDWLGGLGAGLMAGGVGLQGGNPAEVLKGLMSAKLAQQEYTGTKPITKYEKAALVQSQIKILRDTKKDELTNITDQMKKIEDKVGGIHKFFTGEPQGEAALQWKSLYQQAESKRQELEQLDSRLTGEDNSKQNNTNPNIPFQVGQMYNGHKILKVETVGSK
jgi:hypothetical protein